MIRRIQSPLSLMFWSIGILALVGRTARADIAPDPLSGGTNLAIQGKEKTSVAMTDEVVKLKVSRESCHVNVVFTMTNTGKTAETIPVGFPFFHTDELKDFKVTVDGKAIAITNEKGGRVGSGGPDDPAGWKPHWKLWKSTFPPAQPVTIVVSYWTKLFTGRWSRTSELQRVPDLLTSLVPQDEREKLDQQLEARRVTYILRTGSHWSGPISRCRIEVTFDGLSTDNLVLNGLDFEPRQARISANSITWDLKDYEPNRDVEFAITPSITQKGTLSLIERYQKKKPNTLLTAVLAEHLVAAGRQPEAEATLLKFLDQCQDKVVIFGTKETQDLPLDESVNVFRLAQQITINLESQRKPTGFNVLPTFQARNPAAFVPAIKRISLKTKEQLNDVPPAREAFAKRFAVDVDEMLAWCEKHGNE